MIDRAFICGDAACSGDYVSVATKELPTRERPPDQECEFPLP